MHPKFKRADELSHKAIGIGIEVHRFMGAGLIESIYEKCAMHEWNLQNIPVVNQRLVRI